MTEKLLLKVFKNTLEFIAKDFPNASQGYKTSSFVVGAQEMCIQTAKEIGFYNISFCKKVDDIRNEIFQCCNK